MEKSIKQNWHSIPLKDLFLHLQSSPDGLTAEKAHENIKKFGRNVLPQEKPYSKMRLFLSQFKNPLVYILLAIVSISIFLKNYSDAVFVLIVLFINTVVGFWQENKSNKSLLALKKMVRISARVLRDGFEKEIDAEYLAAGDVIFIKAGDKIPADCRIIKSAGLKINEASLTGESLPVEKSASEFLPDQTPLSEISNTVFMGTIAEEGYGQAIVASVGSRTEIGKIVSLLKEVKEKLTPLQKKIAYLSKLLGAMVICVILIIMALGYFTQKSFTEIFVASLALAVSAIPVGLLPAITIILVLGTRRILRKQGLVRQLSAIETIGSVTVICTDKTGTLTEGKMQVSHILTSTKELLAPKIKGIMNGKNINGVESHIFALKIASLVNDAFVENPDAELQEWIIRGRHTDKALLLAGMQAGLEKHELEKQYIALDKIPFSSDLKYAVNLYQFNGRKMLYALGAPEEIIARCRDIHVDGRTEKMGSEISKELLKKFESLTQKGLRVVACAHKDYKAVPKYKNLSDISQGLTLVGFIALKDPLRKDAKGAVELTEKAGIKTIIITGDHKLTAKAVAKEIGIPAQDERILEGKDLEKISDKELKEKAKYVSIYARVSPKHKLRIVDALHSNGEIVAMLGDGVNDAPALKTANVGLTVGSGTDVAKETADIVLLDNSFKTIVMAVEQGRIVFQNIRKVFIYLVADDFSEIFLFLASMLMGLPLPLLPAQILWINLIEDGLPNIALTSEQETKGIMEEKPRDPKEPILNRSLKIWMAVVFFVSGLAAFLSFFILLKLTGNLEKTRAIVFALIGFDSLVFAFSVRSFKETIFRKDIFSNKYLLAAVSASLLMLIGAIYLPILQNLLHTQALGFGGWIFVISISFLEILAIEFYKKKIFK
ncbi:MAG: cation-transporting P-type ATPase [Patescibacteria group bacterium]